MEHGAGVEQLGVVVEATLVAGEGGEVVDAAGVVEEQLGLGVADELLDLTRELGVGDADAVDEAGGSGGHGFDSSCEPAHGYELTVAARRGGLP